LKPNLNILTSLQMFRPAATTVTGVQIPTPRCSHRETFFGVPQCVYHAVFRNVSDPISQPISPATPNPLQAAGSPTHLLQVAGPATHLLQAAGPIAHILQAYLSQINTSSPQFPSTVAPQPPKTSKGIKRYPEIWREVLKATKDAVRADMVINNPFLSASKTRAVANECFHEVLTSKHNEGIIPEPGESVWTNKNFTDLLT
jgi:hypothetical protein